MTLFAPPPPRRAGLLPVPETPGASDASCTKLRLEIGRLSTADVWIVNDRSPVCVCTIGESALTSTICDIPPTSIVSAPSCTRSPAPTTMPERLSVLKPVIVTSRLYAPTEMFGKTKSPELDVTIGDDFVP